MDETNERRGGLTLAAIERAAKLTAEREDTGEIDGFKITAEQCRAINAGEREAVDKFFDENEERLIKLACYYLRGIGFPAHWDSELNCWKPAIIEVGDCLNQLYIDMRRGYLVFALVPKVLSRVICHSFHYAGVGGFGDEDGAYLRGVQ